MADVLGIGIFKFKRGKGKKMEEQMRKHAHTLRGFKGCKGAWLSEADEEEDHYLLFSLWKNMDAHAKMEKKLTEDKNMGIDFKKLSKSLQETPHFGVYEVIE